MKMEGKRFKANTTFRTLRNCTMKIKDLGMLLLLLSSLFGYILRETGVVFHTVRTAPQTKYSNFASVAKLLAI